MPADCAAPIAPATLADEPFLIGEPHAPRPAPGWTAAVLDESARRAAFAEACEKRLREREYPPFGAGASPVFADTIKLALAAREKAVAAALAHSIAEEFGDDDDAARNEAWGAARDALDDALDALTRVEVTTPRLAREKVEVFAAAYAAKFESDGGLKARMGDDFVAQVALASLWRDTKTMEAPPSQNGMPADLVAEFTRLWRLEQDHTGDDASLDAACFETEVVVRRLISMPVRTLEDAAVKAQLVQWAVGDAQSALDGDFLGCGTFGDFARVLMGDLLGQPKVAPMPAKFITRLEQRFTEGTARYRTMLLVDGDHDADEHCQKAMQAAWRDAEAIVALPCENLAGVRAKARVALDLIERDGGSNWRDKEDVRAMQQVIAFVDGQIGPLEVYASPEGLSVSELYECYRAAVETFNSGRDLTSEDAEYAEVNRWQDATLDAPIRSREDVQAKLKMISISLKDGELSNGKDQAAVAQISAWLEAQG